MDKYDLDNSNISEIERKKVGRPAIPKEKHKKVKRVFVTVEEDLYEKICKEADEKGIFNAATYIRYILTQEFRKRD